MPGGIFCIENWHKELGPRATVRPLLEFLNSSGGARFIHQRVSTPRELHHYVALFADQDRHRVGYLAMHGIKGKVLVGSHPVSLERLATWARLDAEDLQTNAELDDP